MQIRLNLATRPLENTRRFVFAAATAGVVLVALLIVLSNSAYHTWKQNREMREEMSRLQSELRDFRDQRRELEEVFRRDETKRAMDRAAFLNGLIEQRSFPWTRIFMDLERLLPPGARVVSLAPKREEGRIELRMAVGAQNDTSKVRFLKALEESAEFERVLVTSERRKDAATGEGDPITMEVSARYRAAAPAVSGSGGSKPATTAQKGGA